MLTNSQIDDKDAKIVTILSQDPYVRQTDLAKAVNLSQPAVGARIKKLIRQGFLSRQYGVNITRAGLYVAKVDAISKAPNAVLKTLEHCPSFIDGFVTSGPSNLSMFFATEDLPSLEAMVECHVKRNAHVDGIQHSVIMTSSRSLVLPMRLEVERRSESPNCGCGVICKDCPHWKENGGSCLGCPASVYYQGTFWK